jgi:hypothetical protein
MISDGDKIHQLPFKLRLSLGATAKKKKEGRFRHQPSLHPQLVLISQVHLSILLNEKLSG